MTDYRKEEISQFRDFTTFRLYEESLEEGISPREALARLNAESREHARTPVQWDDSPWGGFSDREPWFAVNPNYRDKDSPGQTGPGDPAGQLSGQRDDTGRRAGSGAVCQCAGSEAASRHAGSEDCSGASFRQGG